MKQDPYNHARWKHMWCWHKVGCVWEKVALECAGDEDTACKRARCQSIEEKKRFLTSALRSVKHSTIGSECVACFCGH